jgi:hypothetical protein
MNKPYGENRKAALKSFDKKALKTKVDHSNEEKLFKVGQITKDGFTIKELLDDGRVLLTSQNGTKFVNQKDIKIA